MNMGRAQFFEVHQCANGYVVCRRKNKDAPVVPQDIFVFLTFGTTSDFMRADFEPPAEAVEA